MKRILYLLISALIFTSCGDTDSIDLETSDGVMDADTLFLADSIGVLMGDTNYVFGEIRDITPVPEGIAVLDGIYCRLAFFTSEGEFLYSAGRRGEGPGEFGLPWFFARLHDGSWFVMDFGGRQIVALDDTLGYVCAHQAMRNMPMHTVASGDSTVVTQYIAMEFSGEQLMAGYRMVELNVFTGEEEFIYREHVEEMGADTVDVGPYFCAFTVDLEGNIYTADYYSDSYLIDVQTSEGEPLRTIEMEPEERPAFDWQLHSIHYLPITAPLTTVSGTSVLRFSVPETHPYVAGLSIDGDNNIWVKRLGTAVAENWDVISQEGELLRKVVLYADTTGSASYPSLHVSPWGMVATRNEHEVERFYTVNQR